MHRQRAGLIEAAGQRAAGRTLERAYRGVADVRMGWADPDWADLATAWSAQLDTAKLELEDAAADNVRQVDAGETPYLVTMNSPAFLAPPGGAADLQKAIADLIMEHRQRASSATEANGDSDAWRYVSIHWALLETDPVEIPPEPGLVSIGAG